jgi:hypothetical protein
VGGYPVVPALTAEDDPAQLVPPGAGLLAMPPPVGRIASRADYDLWRMAATVDGESLFDVAPGLGFVPALIGDSDFHTLHIKAPTSIIASQNVVDDVRAFATAHTRFLAVVALGGTRTADRHDPRAIAELSALAKTVADLTTLVPSALFVVTSRGATTIDDDGSDYYGPGTSRHVPLVLVGSGVRAGVVSGQPATPADVPATILYALGAPTTTDFALGTWAGGIVNDMLAPIPAYATEGHVLLRAFVP